jgi:hypothetical protein
MLGTYPDAHALPWPAVMPRQRVHRAARAVRVASRRRQALRHGIRGALKATILSAALMAASAVVGASRGPVVLSEPAQPAALHAVAPVTTGPSAGLAAKMTTR